MQGTATANPGRVAARKVTLQQDGGGRRAAARQGQLKRQQRRQKREGRQLTKREGLARFLPWLRAVAHAAPWPREAGPGAAAKSRQRAQARLARHLPAERHRGQLAADVLPWSARAMLPALRQEARRGLHRRLYARRGGGHRALLRHALQRGPLLGLRRQRQAHQRSLHERPRRVGGHRRRADVRVGFRLPAQPPLYLGGGSPIPGPATSIRNELVKETAWKRMPRSTPSRT